VHNLVLEIGQKRSSFHLIESLAGCIAAEMLRGFPIEEVTVRVRKETPIIDGIVDNIGVQVTRRRDWLPQPVRPPARPEGSTRTRRAVRSRKR
jgi:dihydroneopterin aldolase